jgi:phosphonoacetaldehyde hydrolase
MAARGNCVSVKRAAYRGRLKAAILDWAGTTVDYGCQAPAVVLQELFRDRGVPIGIAEARQHMGLLKKDQIQAICAIGRVSTAWSKKHGHSPSENDIAALFQEFIPRQLSCLDRYADLIPGMAETAAQLRARGMKIGTTTGYTRPMLEIIRQKAAIQGYKADSTVCPEDVGGGRPLPWMCYENAIRLKVYPLEACVKIGDTVSDVQEGLNAGMWTIAVALTGNELGLTEQELTALDENERHSRLSAARDRLTAAGAHYVIDSIAKCDAVLDEIERRLREGEAP